MSPVIGNIDAIATSEALAVKYFLAMCDKTGKSLLTKEWQRSVSKLNKKVVLSQR